MWDALRTDSWNSPCDWSQYRKQHPNFHRYAFTTGSRSEAPREEYRVVSEPTAERRVATGLGGRRLDEYLGMYSMAWAPEIRESQGQ